MEAENEFSSDATMCLKAFLQDLFDSASHLSARVEYTDTQKKSFILLKGDITVQEHLLVNGLGRIQSYFLTHPINPVWSDSIQSLLRYQEKAKVQRMNIWQYGEVVTDDEE
eukprot:NODE_7514_length_469_cov_33.097619_g7069_i0.p1 GENE.NODE_7514_length_469_cov_33.097619_g7069_i0~~NODE_7514_length_469_cov_33.097619_g7069_i0.p1  ORF type:complete len:129 (+),score=30.82 NODE_7514_length_469_cov_33.097619_g7069_i0:56-388(+)